MSSDKLAGISILIVENQALIATDIADGLTDVGAISTVCCTTSAAMAALRQRTFTAAIVDDSLGRADDEALYRALRERHLPYVVYSGLPGINGHGPLAAFVGKPASISTLWKSIQAVIDDRTRCSLNTAPSPVLRPTQPAEFEVNNPLPDGRR